MPVHSELRQPRTSSSSAIWSSSSRSLTGLLQLHLQRVPVDAVVVAAELVREVVDLANRVARDDPERRRLAAPPVLLVRVRLREGRVRSGDGAGVLEGLALALLAKDLVDHAASARIACRTQAVS